MKYNKPLMIILLVLSFYGLYLISKGSFKYSQSFAVGDSPSFVYKTWILKSRIRKIFGNFNFSFYNFTYNMEQPLDSDKEH